MVTDSTAAAPVPRGRLLAGSYELLDEIGSGSIGRVYRALRLADGRMVAVKVIRIDDVAADYERRLRREPEIQHGVGHENIIELLDWFRVGDQFLLVMEYVDGESLGLMIRRSGGLPASLALDVTCQLLRGVAHLHELGIVHRDIKPSNILIDRSGRAKLADFGIADCAWQLRRAHGRVGTPEYMSPEQVRGEEVDARSDLYSLGITIHEMITGRNPFVGDGETSADYVRVFESVLTMELPVLAFEPSDLSADLPGILSRMTAKDRDLRPSDAAELLDLLGAAPKEDGGDSSEGGSLPEPSGWRRRLGLLAGYLRSDWGR